MLYAPTVSVYIATSNGIFRAQLPTSPAILTQPAVGDTVMRCASSADPLVFAWSAVTGATSYDIQIDNDPAFGTPETTVVGIGNPFSYGTSLANYSTTYYWRVRSTDGTNFGKSPWGSSSSFITQPINPPVLNPPTLVSPANGATGVATNPTFIWNSVPGAKQYELVVVGKDPVYTKDTVLQISGLSLNTTYSWNVTSVNCAANSPSSNRTFTTCTNCQSRPQGPTTSHSGEKESGVITDFQLMQNYPNPFNPTTRFDYTLPVQSHVRLRIFNTLGQVIATVVDEYQSPGLKSAEFNAQNLPSGLYFYRLEANQFMSIKKMMLVK